MASPESPSLSKLTLHSTEATSHESVESASCPFFEVLPLEIRRKIYGYAFEGSVMQIIGFSPPACYICPSCGLRALASSLFCCGKPLTRSWSSGPNAHNVLLTCSSMYHEARSILAASVEVRFARHSRLTLVRLREVIHKHTFLEFAAPHVKHVSATHLLYNLSTTICKIFTGVQLISFGPPYAWQVNINELLEDGQYDAEHAKSIGRLARLSASELDHSPNDTKDDLHIHFHYHRMFQGSEYVSRLQNWLCQLRHLHIMQRLVYDLTSDVILGEDIEMRSWGIWLREAHRVVGQKLHR
jgi:hypothetical protein